MAYEATKVLIWGKTYPEFSDSNVETVCTGGVREDGRPIRLFPVPLRYLEPDQQYSLYHWIEVPIEKSSKDPRAESFKVDPERIRVLSDVPTDQDGWQARRQWIFKDPSWHFGSVQALKEAQGARGLSMGMVTPRVIEGVRVAQKPASARQAYERKKADVTSKGDLFRTEYKELAFIPFEVRLRWRCEESCVGCTKSPHEMQVLDWGLLELGRRAGPEAAQKRLETISDLATHDFRIYMGNFRLHMHNFGVIGLWYPKIPAQPSLFG